MTIVEIRHKLLSGEISDKQFLELLNQLEYEEDLEPEESVIANESQERQMLKKLLEYSMLLVILGITVLLSYWNKVDITLTISILSIVTGYVLGRIR